jgi:hypothetical protein
MNNRAAGAVVALALAFVAGCAGGGPAGERRAAAAAPGVWYQPLGERPGQARAVQAAAGPEEPYFDEACGRYITDEALFLRCQWVTGPDMAQHVPVIGLDAPLPDRMRCHPLRDDPPGYRACLGRPS